MVFQPPVQFPVYADGRRLTAFVLEEIDNPFRTVFRLAFSDGFEDEFLIEDDGNVYGSGIVAIPYAKAIRFDIAHVVGLDPSRFYYNYQELLDGVRTNVWVIEDEDEKNEVLFKVYYHEYFRFALKRRNHEWVISDRPLYGKEPDPLIVKKTGYMLDSLLDEPANEPNRQIS